MREADSDTMLMSDIGGQESFFELLYSLATLLCKGASMETPPGWLTSRRIGMFCMRPDIPLRRFGPISAPKPHFSPGVRGRERVLTARWPSAHSPLHDPHPGSHFSGSATVVSAGFDPRHCADYVLPLRARSSAPSSRSNERQRELTHNETLTFPIWHRLSDRERRGPSHLEREISL